MRKFGLIGCWVRSLATGPPAFLLLFLAVFATCWWIARRRDRKLRAGTWVIAFAVYTLTLSFPHLAFILEYPLRAAAGKLLEHRQVLINPPLDTRESWAGTVILVLGGGTDGNGGLTAASLTRLDHGAMLCLNRPGAMLLFTEGGLEPDATAAREYLRFKGLPPERLLLETQGGDTQQGIKLSAQILDDRNASEVILVTSLRHLPRAYLVARNYGLKPHVSAPPKQPDLRLCPQWGAFQYMSAVLNEYAGLAGYWLAGWL